jgi:hypothetical protein
MRLRRPKVATDDSEVDGGIAVRLIYIQQALVLRDR